MGVGTNPLTGDGKAFGLSGQGVSWTPAMSDAHSPRGFWERTASSVADLDSTTLLTVYLFLLMFIPSTLIFSPLGGAGTPAIVLSLLIFLWYIASWCVGSLHPSGGGRPIRIAMYAFTMAVLFSFIAAMTRDITQVEVLAADRGLITFVSWIGLLIVTSQSITSYDKLDILLRRAVLMGSVVAAIGIFEFYSNINVTSDIQVPGLSINTAISTSTLYRNGFVRPSSTAIQPIEFGVVMAMLLPFALHQAFYSARAGVVRRWLPVALIAFAIPVAVSRSGVLAAVVALLFFVPTWNSRRRKGFLASCVVGLVPLHAAAPGLIGTLGSYFGGIFGSTDNTSLATRTSDYSRDWPYIVQRPIFGRGFDTFIPQIYAYTDNAYLHELIECGIVGLVTLIVLFLAGMHCGAVARKWAQDERRRDLGQALVASIAAAAVASATFDSLDFPMFIGTFFLILGVAGAYAGVASAERRVLSALYLPGKARNVGTEEPK
jgi:polysaccharide biosynthesis protein PslJ